MVRGCRSDLVVLKLESMNMHEVLTSQKSGSGRVVAMTPEMAGEAGDTEGSFLVFYLRDGQASAEILSPLTKEKKRGVGGERREIR